MERAAMIGAPLVGFDLLTGVLGVTAMTGAKTDVPEKTAAESVQRLIDPR